MSECIDILLYSSKIRGFFIFLVNSFIMSKSDIYIVATIHGDPDGHERLMYLLDDIRPSIIGLELPKEVLPNQFLSQIRSTDANNACWEQWAETYDLAGIKVTEEEKKSFIPEYFELRTALDYSRRNPHIDLINIDKTPDMGYDEVLRRIWKCPPAYLNALLAIPEKRDEAIIELERMKDSNLSLKYNRTITDIAYDDFGLTMNDYMSRRDVLSADEESLLLDIYPEGIIALEHVVSPERDAHMAKEIRNAFDGSGSLVAIVGLFHAPRIKSHILDLNPKVVSLRDYCIDNGFKPNNL